MGGALGGVRRRLARVERGQLLPRHLADGFGHVLLPLGFTVTATDATTGEVLFSGTDTVTKRGQRRGLQDRLTTCTFGQTFTENGITLTVSGTVTAFITPRGR